MNPLVLHHNLGLGDHIMCNGLVRSLLNDGRCFTDIYIFAKEKYKKSVDRMYGDDNRIHTIAVPNDPSYECSYVNQFVGNNPNLGAFIRAQNGVIDNLITMGIVSNFDEGFYVCCGIPFERRWSWFKLNRNIEEENRVLKKLNPSNEKYIFVHDEPSMGNTVVPENPNNLKIIKNDKDECIFDMVGILENASEIHCMESSIKCLIDHLPNITCPLYFYNIRSHGLVSKTKKNWINI